jgi:two-component system, OmpR family, sensor histidine kinase QseC
MKRLPSLQARLLALLMAVVAGVWLASAVAVWVDASHELDELLDGHLAQAAALLVAQQANAGDGADEPFESDDEPLGRYAGRVAFQVWHEGVLVLRSSNAPTAPMSSNPRGFETLVIDGQNWRVVAARGAERDVQVYVAELADSRRDILRALLRSSLWPLLVALPLLALLGWWAVRRGLAPLQQLSERLAQRRPHALDAVGFADAPAEMRPLVEALDSLFARIAALLESERRFTADAAHELRTPVAAIRAQAQVALGADNTEERRHALHNTLEGCDRAARLIEQLLVLARLEAAPGAAPHVRTDLARLAQRVAADLSGAALAKRQAVELDAPAHCEVAGDEALLGILLRNLVDNAIRYSPERATVRVALVQSAAGTVLTVDDSGPGLADADLARLGERFFRVLGSGERGSGLGWSIVQRIARTQGATISAAPSSALGGLQVRVVWPA